MCGVIGIIGSPEAAKEAFLGLIMLQHRGQDAAGVLSYDQTFHHVKGLGLVESIFDQKAIESLPGHTAIAHTRYSTVGRGGVNDVQPLMVNYPYGIGMVHNGNVVNYLQLKERLQNEMHRRCFTESDTETILNWFAHKLEGIDFASIEKAVASVFENIHGSYSITGILGEGGLFAFRDPTGVRPLVLGKKKTISGKSAYIVASETVVLSFLGYEVERDVLPGELIYIDLNGNLHATVVSHHQEHRPCMFEWVYFASAESQVESTPVYGVRLALGKNLARRVREKIDRGELKVDLIAPIPDTSRTAATALAEELKIPHREVLIKNRYITRTFILGSQAKREKAVGLKLNAIVSEIRGKNVMLVDDSIVRGTTSKKIVQLVRQAGANKVYFVSTCPPIRFPCFYGIDFPDQKELIASSMDLQGSVDSLEKNIAAALGADAVVYQDFDGLISSIVSQNHGRFKRPCMACLDGNYPTDVSASSRFSALRQTDRGKSH